MMVGGHRSYCEGGFCQPFGLGTHDKTVKVAYDEVSELH